MTYEFTIEKSSEGYRYLVKRTSFPLGVEPSLFNYGMYTVTVEVSAFSDDYAAVYRDGVAACIALDPSWVDAWADAQ